MIKKIKLLIVFMMFLAPMLLVQNVSATHVDGHLAPRAPLAGECDGSFFGIPSWHKYLEKRVVHELTTGQENSCEVQLKGIADVWLIVAAVIEILLRVAAIVAIGFIIYGGVQYVISQGAPDKTKVAQQTIIDAVIGLVISIVAAAIVSFIAGRFN